jgi:hypothetical protein
MSEPIVRMRALLDGIQTEMRDAHEDMQRLTNEEQAIHRTQQLAVTRYNGLQSAYHSLLSAVLHLEKSEKAND